MDIKDEYEVYATSRDFVHLQHIQNKKGNPLPLVVGKSETARLFIEILLWISS